MNPLLIAYQSFVEDWQDIIGPSSLDIFEGGYFLGKRRAAADLAKAREEGWWEGQKEMLDDVRRWWRCACETHPVRSQREMNRNHFFLTALLNELQYPKSPLRAKEAGDDGPEAKTH